MHSLKEIDRLFIIDYQKNKNKITILLMLCMCYRNRPITVKMHWLCKCVVGLLALTATGSVPIEDTQKCVPPGPGLSLNDFLSGQFYLFERQQAFSIKLLQTAVAASPKQNLIFSPHSIYTALLITYFLSGNQTEEILKKFLNLPPEQVR